MLAMAVSTAASELAGGMLTDSHPRFSLAPPPARPFLQPGAPAAGEVKVITSECSHMRSSTCGSESLGRAAPLPHICFQQTYAVR
jgi:hypothetical protein